MLKNSLKLKWNEYHVLFVSYFKEEIQNDGPFLKPIMALFFKVYLLITDTHINCRVYKNLSVYSSVNFHIGNTLITHVQI